MATLKEIPPEHTFYTVNLSNKNSYKINGEEQQTLLTTTSQFVKLRSGDVINKSFIVDIVFDFHKTQDHLSRLPSEVKNKLLLW